MNQHNPVQEFILTANSFNCFGGCLRGEIQIVEIQRLSRIVICKNEVELHMYKSFTSHIAR